MRMFESLESRTLLSFSGPIVSNGGAGTDLRVADFNQDGKDDVAVLGDRNSVVVSLSNGDGSFRKSATLYKAKGELRTLAATDVNGDGRRDIVAHGVTLLSSNPSNTYTVYTNVWLGKGDGSFQSPTTTQTTNSYPPYDVEQTRAFADFNRDGNVDYAQLGYFGGVHLYVANPDGSYQASQSYPATSETNPTSITAGDFNGDGWKDVVVVNNLYAKRVMLTVLLNNGVW
jgi:hypothetical protein